MEKVSINEKKKMKTIIASMHTIIAVASLVLS